MSEIVSKVVTLTEEDWDLVAASVEDIPELADQVRSSPVVVVTESEPRILWYQVP